MTTLRQKQISEYFFLKIRLFDVLTSKAIILDILDAIKQMLNLNQPQNKLGLCEPVWKVLVYDRVGQDIISPLISVKELRELGVTLFV